MKLKIINTSIITIFLLLIILISFYIGKTTGMKSMFSEPVYSPSENYEYYTILGGKESRYLKIVIAEVEKVTMLKYEGHIEDTDCYMIEEKFYTRYDILYGWGENDTLWVYSGDTGISFWQNNDNIWEENIADETSILLAPDNIKEIWDERYGS